MSTVPWPYGGSAAEVRLGRMSFGAAPPSSEWSEENERRHRAEVARAFRAGDNALAQIERRLKALEAAVAP